MKKFIINRLNLFSLVKFGFVIGLIIAFPLVSICIIGAWRASISLLDWLLNNDIVIPLNFWLINQISIDPIDILEGWEPFEYLRTFAGYTWSKISIYILITTFLAGIWTSLVGFFSGLAYNILAWLTGGQRISMSVVAEQVKFRSKQSPSPKNTAPDNQQPAIDSPEKPGGSDPNSSATYLEIISPIQRILLINKEDILIGSGPESEISLENLDDRHAQIFYRNGDYYLRDLSQGKTIVQGYSVKGLSLLRDNFQIQLGPYRMIFRYGA